jgi:hypothetical protein
MANNRFYFSHDYNARNDIKLAELNADLGMEGVGIYWCLIEILYENDGYLSMTDIPRIAKGLRINATALQSVIDTSLFEHNEEQFWSNSVLKRLEERNEKSKKASESALNRWGKHRENKGRLRKATKRIITLGQDVQFEKFWTAYPKKLARKVAEKAFASVMAEKHGAEAVDQLMTAILSSLERSSKSQEWLKDNGQYIPYPATWLNQHRWEDEITDGGGTNGANRNDTRTSRTDRLKASVAKPLQL